MGSQKTSNTSSQQQHDHIITMNAVQSELSSSSPLQTSTAPLNKRISEQQKESKERLFIPTAQMEESEEELGRCKGKGGDDNNLPDYPIQLLSYQSLSERVKTNIDITNPKTSQGLSASEVAERLERDGPNCLTPPPELPEILKYLSHYTDPFMILLMIAGTLSIITISLPNGPLINLWVGIALFTVVIISSSFAYIQSGKASAVMKSFKTMLPRRAHVIREGRLQDIPAADLVVGDIVRVGTGDQCPADLRLIYVNELKVEVSSLTGEC